MVASVRCRSHPRVWDQAPSPRGWQLWLLFSEWLYEGMLYTPVQACIPAVGTLLIS